MAHKKKAHSKHKHDGERHALHEPMGKPKGEQHLKEIKKGHKAVRGK